ncbi:MAG: hypothetical protein R2744_08730 [Bacteroidales bacterium]
MLCSSDDDLPSLPVDFTSSVGFWPRFRLDSIQYQKMYGTSGNSFVAAVEFGGKG